jgi:hypothetical protein
LGIKPVPNVEVIVHLFEQVLKNEISREEVAEYAMYFIRNDSIYDIRDKDVCRLLDLASGIDLKDSPTDYLHDEQDIMQWINCYKK